MKLSSLESDNLNQLGEIEVLQEEMAELSTDMKSCKEKEAKLLEFTEKLTETNVSLQVCLNNRDIILIQLIRLKIKSV